MANLQIRHRNRTETPMLPITEIAKMAGVDDKYLEQYGKYKAKVDYNILNDVKRPDGKLSWSLPSTPPPPVKARPPRLWVWPTA